MTNGAGDIPAGAHLMQCMEVWGGNRAIDNGVVMPGLDAWVYSMPWSPAGKAEASGGGDIHYVTSCATGRITRLMVADVSGHGETVAKAAVALRRLLCKYSNFIDQSKFIEAVNENFAEIAAGAEEELAPGAFATAVVATYFAPTDELSIASAGHPRPMRFDAKRRTWEVLVASSGDRDGLFNLPLGVDTPTKYPSGKYTLGRNDVVFFYTDSLTEAKLPGGRLLGEAGLVDVLKGVAVEDPSKFIPEVLGRIRAMTADDAFDDDVTALLIRRNELKPRPSLALSMQSVWRIGKQAIGSLRPGALPAAFPELTVRAIGGAIARRLNDSRTPE